MKTRKPTQKEIARLAGVSQALVSLVLSESTAPVAAEARERVLKTAQQLGYKGKNRLRKPKNRQIIAYIRPMMPRSPMTNEAIHRSYEFFYDQIQNLLVEKAYAFGFEMIVRPYARPADLTHWLIEWGVDGVFWQTDDDNLMSWIAQRYPLVQINNDRNVPSDAVLPNQNEIIELAVNHLRQYGHERITLVNGGRNDRVAQDRVATFEGIMRDLRLPIDARWLHEDDPDTLVRWLVERRPDAPTALIMGDYSALVLQKKLQKEGFILPDELSMVGIDNINASEFSSPCLSSVDIQMEEIVNAALSVMTARLEKKIRSFQRIAISPRLVERDSVAPPMAVVSRK